MSQRCDEALIEVQEATGLSITESFNRSLVLYALLLRETAAREPDARKGDLIIYMSKPGNTGEKEKIVVL